MKEIEQDNYEQYPKKGFKVWLRKWLDVEGPVSRYLRQDDTQYKFTAQYKQIKDLTDEVARTQKFIGALYDYLEIRPQRTFVQDFSRLPEEYMPTMEVVKAVKPPKLKRRP